MKIRVKFRLNMITPELEMPIVTKENALLATRLWAATSLSMPADFLLAISVDEIVPEIGGMK